MPLLTHDAEYALANRPVRISIRTGHDVLDDYIFLERERYADGRDRQYLAVYAR